MTTPFRRFGWKPDRPDYRDTYRVIRRALLLPESIDLLKGATDITVRDQGNLGSCTGNGIGEAFEYDHLVNFEEDFTPSRNFIYYNEREKEGTVDFDAGASIRDGIKSVVTDGVCSESLWPYDISQFTTKPSPAAYQEALKHKVVKYERITQNLTAFKTVLALGFPIVLGFTVYESFMSLAVEKTGIVPMPNGNESAEGGHCVLLTGYDDLTSRWKLRNSWGENWGDKGNFYMPYAYLLDPDLSRDFWTIESVSNDSNL